MHRTRPNQRAAVEILEPRLLLTSVLDPTFGIGGIARFGERVPAYGGRDVLAIVGLPGGDALSLYDDFTYNEDGTSQTNSYLLARVDPAGEVNPVGVDVGTSSTLVAAKLALQGADRVILAAQTETGVTVARFTLNGAADASFGAGGTASVVLKDRDTIQKLVNLTVDSDGKIILVLTETPLEQGIYPYTSNLLVLRFNADGSRDTAFGKNGMVTSASTSMIPQAAVMQSDGKIITAGQKSTSEFFGIYQFVARFNADGTLDTSFGGGDGIQTFLNRPNPAGSVPLLTLQADNRILMSILVRGGSPSEAYLLRFTANGQPDTTFSGDGSLILTLDPIYPEPPTDLFVASKKLE